MGNDPVNARDPSGEDTVRCNIVDDRLRGCIIESDESDATEVVYTISYNQIRADGSVDTNTTTVTQSFDGSISNPSVFQVLSGHRNSILSAISRDIRNLTSGASNVRLVYHGGGASAAFANLIDTISAGMWGGSRPPDAGRGRGANRTDARQVADVAREFGIDRRAFGNYVERVKRQEGRGGMENYSYSELRELAQDFLRISR